MCYLSVKDCVGSLGNSVYQQPGLRNWQNPISHEGSRRHVNVLQDKTSGSMAQFIHVQAHVPSWPLSCLNTAWTVCLRLMTSTTDQFTSRSLSLSRHYARAKSLIGCYFFKALWSLFGANENGKASALISGARVTFVVRRRHYITSAQPCVVGRLRKD